MTISRLSALSDWYVSPAEFGDWVRDCVKQHDLNFLFARVNFRDEARLKFAVCQSLPWKDRAVVTRTVRDYEALYLSVATLKADVPDINYLPENNRSALRINLPAFSVRGMTGLGISLGTQIAPYKKVYQAILKDLTARTGAGVWFRFAKGKKKEWFDPYCRFSPGAIAILEQGVPLDAGGSIVVSRFEASRKER